MIARGNRKLVLAVAAMVFICVEVPLLVWLKAESSVVLDLRASDVPTSRQRAMI